MFTRLISVSVKNQYLYLYQLFLACLVVGVNLCAVQEGKMIACPSMNITIRRLGGVSILGMFTTTWLHKYDHMARYFPIFLTFGTSFQFLTTEARSRYNLHLK